MAFGQGESLFTGRLLFGLPPLEELPQVAIVERREPHRENLTGRGKYIRTTGASLEYNQILPVARTEIINSYSSST